MKIYINRKSFWPGFMENKDPVKLEFFINLFQKVFKREITICDNIKECDILFESIFASSLLYEKRWKYTIIFSGESYNIQNIDHYDVVLWGNRTENNIINIPLFSVNIFGSNFLEVLEGNRKITKVPKRDICCIISNPNGKDRNKFISQLEKEIKIDHFGKYKNNKFLLKAPYNSKEFYNIISNYKFVITMENGRKEEYLTEKILHGFMSDNIPIYWGCKEVSKYFNKDRFINIEEMTDERIKEVIDEIKEILRDDEKYLQIVNKPVFFGGKLHFTLDDIVEQIQELLQIE